MNLQCNLHVTLPCITFNYIKFLFANSMVQHNEHKMMLLPESSIVIGFLVLLDFELSPFFTVAFLQQEITQIHEQKIPGLR